MPLWEDERDGRESVSEGGAGHRKRPACRASARRRADPQHPSSRQTVQHQPRNRRAGRCGADGAGVAGQKTRHRHVCSAGGAGYDRRTPPHRVPRGAFARLHP